MKEETLKKAKALEADIREMETALDYFKRGKWHYWGINDTSRTFHFAFHKHYGDSSAHRQDLPTWLNKPLMEVVERELNRCKAQLAALTDDSEDGALAEIPSEQVQHDDAPEKVLTTINKSRQPLLVYGMVMLYAWMIFCIVFWLLGFSNWITAVSNTLFTAFLIYLVDTERRRLKNKED